MNKTNVIRSIAALSALAILVTAIPAAAAATSTKKAAKGAAQLTAIISRSDKAIEARLADLQSLSSRIVDMKNLSDTQKTGLTSEIDTQVSGLTSLKAKIDADTDTVTAKADEKSITADYRIYALAIPQGRITASADRIVTIAGILNTIGAKLQARITAAQAAGKDVTAANATLADFAAKMNDALSKAQSAGTSILALVPDKGDAAVAASNKAALTAARADIQTATADVQAARKDTKSLLAAIKGFKLPASGAATSTATTTTVTQ